MRWRRPSLQPRYASPPPAAAMPKFADPTQGVAAHLSPLTYATTEHEKRMQKIDAFMRGVRTPHVDTKSRIHKAPEGGFLTGVPKNVPETRENGHFFWPFLGFLAISGNRTISNPSWKLELLTPCLEFHRNRTP